MRLLNGDSVSCITFSTERCNHLITTQKVALVANHTSLVGQRHLVDTLLACGTKIEKIFCPEHGFRGTAAAGAHVGNSFDSATGIAIVSLYGKNKKPAKNQLDDIGLVIFDLQDVGCRFYTYISTLQYVMEACAECGIPLLLLDRPNPNGHYIDGPVMEASLRSFVGMQTGVPVVYGMTIGEYALMLNGERRLTDSLHCELHIVPLSGYSHDSACCRNVPNLRTRQSIALYPSLCLFEGTTISVGRGTPHPFEVIGNEHKMDLRDVDVPSRIDLQYVIRQYRLTPKGKFFLKNNFFEKLAGTTALRQQIERGLDEAAIRATWQKRLDDFKRIRKRYLIYN